MKKLSLILTVGFSILYSLLYSQDKDTPSQIEEYLKELTFHNGEHAPIFSLKDTSDQTVRLSDFSNNVVVLDFWGTYCKPCIAGIPMYNKVQSFFNDSSNVIFISICFDKVENKKRWKNLINEHKIQGVHLFLSMNVQQSEENSFYIENINNMGVPTCLLISKNGMLLGELPDVYSGIMPYVIYRGLENISTGNSVKEASENTDAFNNWLKLNNNLSKFMEFVR
jgi:thiol-disulfide isomerase/thioredoxin